MAKLNLDLTNVETEKPSIVSLLPAGVYNAVIFSSEVKETKAGGYGLTIYFRILDGEHADKCFKDFLNIVNASEQAQRIALSRLKLIAELSGHANPNKIGDSEELHGKKLVAHLTVKDSLDNQGKAMSFNEVKKYEAYRGATLGESKPQVLTAVTSAKAKLPWEL